MQQINVEIKRLPGSEDIPLPKRMSEGAAGYDLCACLDEVLKIAPGERILVPTGLSIAMPNGLEAQIRPRSGLAFKQGITCLNTPGTIDADYRGEIKVLLINLGTETVTIERGDRIAQMVFQEIPMIKLQEVEALSATLRGAGGFGHTGKK